jgi:hypothetical protein
MVQENLSMKTLSFEASDGRIPLVQSLDDLINWSLPGGKGLVYWKHSDVIV